MIIFMNCEEVKTDTTPPTITITSPSNNSVVSEIMLITCMGYDDTGIQKVELWVNGISTGLEDYSEPYSFAWNTTQLSDAIYTIIVRAYDGSGNVTDSSPLSLEVYNQESYPTSVELFPIEYNNNTLIVRWSMSTDSDFNSYMLYESVSGEPASMSEIYSTTDVFDTTFVVSGVLRREVRYYQVSVMDTVEFISNSLIVNRVVNEEFTFSLYESESNQIYMMDENGENMTNLSNSDYNDHSPNWFPDGDQLLFLRQNPSPSVSTVLMMMDSDGNNQIILSSSSAQHSQVSISNDGSMVLYVPHNLQEIFLTDIATGSNTRLSDPDFIDSSPIFSPDNSSIIYSSRHADSQQSNIFMMNVDGSEKTNLTNSETTSAYNPQYSPDGSMIVYYSDFDLYLMDLDGLISLNLTNDDSNPFRHNFSPDGSQIVYVGFSSDIFLIDIDASFKSNLTKGIGYSDFPIFFPDGQKLLFISHRNGVRGIYKIDADGSNEIKIADFDESIGLLEFRP